VLHSHTISRYGDCKNDCSTQMISRLMGWADTVSRAEQSKSDITDFIQNLHSDAFGKEVSRQTISGQNVNLFDPTQNIYIQEKTLCTSLVCKQSRYRQSFT
jgi:hypothetical protein